MDPRQIDTLFDYLERISQSLEALLEREPAAATTGALETPTEIGFAPHPETGDVQFFSRSENRGDRDNPEWIWALPEAAGDLESIAGDCRGCAARIHWVYSLQPRYRYLKAVPLDPDGHCHWDTCSDNDENRSAAKDRAVAQVRGEQAQTQGGAGFLDTDVPF